jgi:hypothetical protein
MGSKKFSSLIENVVSTFAEDQQLYRNDICPKALVKFLEPILCTTWFALTYLGRCCDICLLGMFIYLFELLFILHSIYFQISKISFCSKCRKTNLKFWRLTHPQLLEGLKCESK